MTNLAELEAAQEHVHKDPEEQHQFGGKRVSARFRLGE
jgi:hypothetical protein